MVSIIKLFVALALAASQVAGQKITQYSINQVERGEAAWITLRWSGIQCSTGQSCSHPSADVSDRIALVYGGEAQPSKPKHTIKHLFVHQAAPATFAKGVGAARFWVPNQRFEIRAVYIRRDMTPGGDSATRSIWKNTAELASAVIPAWKPNYPALGRLSILDDSYGRVAVTWHTCDALPDSKVQWGTKSTALTNTAAAVFDTSYSSSAMCGVPANYEGWGAGTDTINTAVIDNLAPNTTYFYNFGSQTAGYSTVLKFTTPPAADVDAPVNILLVADSGHWSPDGAYETSGISYKFQDLIPYWAGVPGIGSIAYTATEALLKAGGDAPVQPAAKLVYKALRAELNKKGKQYHAALFAGDLAYAEGESAQWQAFLWGISSIVQRVPAMYIPGNHEIDAPTGLTDAPSYALGLDSGGECGQAYRSLFRMPAPTGPDNDFYSYNIGPVHFVMLSSERNNSKGSAQYEWMKQDLQGVDRAVTPWAVVSVHRPLYSDTSSKAGADIAEQMRIEIEPLLAEMQVDLVFGGHVHDYKRSCPVLKSTCVGYDKTKPPVAKGTVHVYFGNGGHQQQLSQYPQQPSWAEKSFPGYGYSTMSATKTQIIIQSYNTSGAVIDSLTLNKPAGWTPDRKAAAAAYDNTPATPSPPSTLQLYDVASKYAPGFLLYLTANANNPQLKALLGPGSEVYNLTNARPGSASPTHDMVSGSLSVQSNWDVRQVWVVTRAVATFLQPLTSQSYFKPLASDVSLLLNMTAPGGRLYFGP